MKTPLRSAVLALVSFGLASLAYGSTVVDLKEVKAGTFAAAGCSWESALHRLRLEEGEYLIWDSGWNPAKPDASGSFFNDDPGLNVVLDGDCAIAVSNVVAVTRTGSRACTNSVVDLGGHVLSLELRGDYNRFWVRGESTDIRAAVHVPASSRLEVHGDGALDVYVYGGAPACIGSNYKEDSGTIVVNGGSIKAEHKELDKCRLDAGLTGAAIGSGAAGNAGPIEINGGTVSATSEKWAAGIGAGANYKGDKNSGWAVPGAGAFDILVAGGSVEASGGADGGSGLGGGHSYSRDDWTGACEAASRVRILGGTVRAVAGATGNANCGATAIGSSRRNAGAQIVLSTTAAVAAAAQNGNNRTLVQGTTAVSDGTLRVLPSRNAASGFLVLSPQTEDPLSATEPKNATSTRTMAGITSAVASGTRLYSWLPSTDPTRISVR